MVLVDIIGSGVGGYLDISQRVSIPMGFWLSFLMLGLLIAPFLAFHTIRKKRDELQAELQTEKDLPKLPHPELYITYHKHEFGIAGEGKYIDTNVDKGTPILSIEAEFRPTGQMRIETVELWLAGKRLPSLNYEVQESSDRLWFSTSNIFNISGISVGKHNAELLSLANGEWWRSYSFLIEVSSR